MLRKIIFYRRKNCLAHKISPFLLCNKLIYLYDKEQPINDDNRMKSMMLIYE